MWFIWCTLNDIWFMFTPSNQEYKNRTFLHFTCTLYNLRFWASISLKIQKMIFLKIWSSDLFVSLCIPYVVGIPFTMQLVPFSYPKVGPRLVSQALCGVMVSLCHCVMVWRCHSVMVWWCHSVIVWWCDGVIVSLCHGVIVSLCHCVMVWWCHSVIVWWFMVS